MDRTANPAPKINIADRSPAWTGTGCYVSPQPTIMRDVYDRTTGETKLTRLHLWPGRPGEEPIIPCKPALCRECERERTWHDHGEVDA